jgi:hypothetical protein
VTVSVVLYFQVSITNPCLLRFVLNLVVVVCVNGNPCLCCTCTLL